MGYVRPRTRERVQWACWFNDTDERRRGDRSHAERWTLDAIEAGRLATLVSRICHTNTPTPPPPWSVHPRQPQPRRARG